MANNHKGGGSGHERSENHGRGFASMSDGEQREIARKGGEAVSQDRQHMADIGRKGGEASAESRSGASGSSRSGSSSSRSGSPGRNDDNR
jgi:general stress protein YciG